MPRSLEINLALLNYYFRSKEKTLSNSSLLESLRILCCYSKSFINDPDSSFEDKLDFMVEPIFTRLLINEDIPMFILSESEAIPMLLLKVIMRIRLMIDSVFIHQLQNK